MDQRLLIMQRYLDVLRSLGGAASAGEIATALGMSRQGVSKALWRMYDLQLVTAELRQRPSGRPETVYRAKAEKNGAA